MITTHVWMRILADWDAPFELARLCLHPAAYGEGVPYGDGKPVILVPNAWNGDTALAMLAHWLGEIGYRPSLTGLAMVTDVGFAAERVAAAALAAAKRVGRKVILVGHGVGGDAACRAAAMDPRAVSDVIRLGLGVDPSCQVGRTPVHWIVSEREADVSVAVCRVPGPPSALVLNPDAYRALAIALRKLPIELIEPGTII